MQPTDVTLFEIGLGILALGIGWALGGKYLKTGPGCGTHALVLVGIAVATIALLAMAGG